MTGTRRKLLLGLAGVLAVAALVLFLLVQSANRILKSELERRLGKDFSIAGLNLSWGSVQARGVKLLRQGEVFSSTEAITLKADFLGFLKDRVTVSEVALEKPFLRLEMDKSGRLLLPQVSAEGETGGSRGGSGSQIEFKRIEVKGGEVLYLDGKISSPPHPTRLTDVESSLSNIAVPPDNAWADCSLSARIPGKSTTGTLRWKGKTNFTNADTDGTLVLRDLDLIVMKPYYHKRGDAEVSRGTLSVDMEVRIKGRKVRAPGKAVIRGLEFRTGRGPGETFMGAPRTLVLDLLKTGNNEIVLDFVVEGSIDDPRFNLREAMMTRLAVGLAQRLGLSVLGAGQPAMTESLRGLKEVGRGLNRLLGR